MGLSGVEYIYNHWLNQYGTLTRKGQVPGLAGGNVNKGDNHNLILTVDLKIQDILEKYIADVSTSHEGIRLGVMVMETKTGNIIGCVNSPSFDPNRFREYKKAILENIFIEPVAVPVNIQSFLIDVADLQAGGERADEVLPWSISESTANLSSELRLWDKLGLNDHPHLDFIAENENPRKTKLSIQNNRSNRNSNTVSTIESPVQVLMALTRILNDGRKITPRVVDPEKNPTGGVQLDQSKDDSVIRKDVSIEAQNLFAAYTTIGPLSSGFITGEGVSFSKTGMNDDFQRSQMMLAMIPSKGAELAMLVIVNYPGLDPAGSGKSGMIDLVAPAMKMIYPIVTLQQVLTHLSDMMTAEEKEKTYYQSAQPTNSTSPRTNEILDANKGLKVMPDLMGLSLRKSLRLLQRTNMEILVRGTGRVTAQSPSPGSALTNVKECQITLQQNVNKSRPGKELTKPAKKTESGSSHEIRK